jgi:hypothetical protein
MASLAYQTRTTLVVSRWPENQSELTYQIQTKDGIVGVPDTNAIGWWPQNQSDKWTALVFFTSDIS